MGRFSGEGVGGVNMFIDTLILHFQAPLMSFGAPQVDQIGPTGRFPTLSQVAGLLANALGYDHRDWAKTQALQDRLLLASLLVGEGKELPDYQTVDLSQTHLRQPAWTTRGQPEHRDGGPDARFGTHIRFRRYRADASVLAAVTLAPADVRPTLDDLKRGLERPARPLFLGRKNSLPASPVLVGQVVGIVDLATALQAVPTTFPKRWSEIVSGYSGRSKCAEHATEIPIVDERALSVEKRLLTERVVDQRDWQNGIHGGERVVLRYSLSMPPIPEDSA